MRSHENPMRSRAPGAKFSTMTSQCSISLVKIALPSSDLVLRVMLRLLPFSMVKYRLSTSGMSCNWPRVASPTPGRSTFRTSAPNQASNCVQVGPDWTWVMSRIFTPCNALDIAFFFPDLESNLRAYFFFSTLCGLRFPMRPLSLPAAGSISALINVGLPESIASLTARFSSSGLVTLTPTPPKAAIIWS